MKIKETISSLVHWFSTVVIVNIRDEDNYELKQTLRLSHFKVVAYLSLILSIVFVLSFILIKTVLASWFDPVQIRLDSDNKMLALSYRVDSLEHEITGRDLYLESLTQAINGGEKTDKQKAELASDSTKADLNVELNQLSESELLLRKEFESKGNNEISKLADERIRKQNFSVPLMGVQSQSSNKIGLIITSSTDRIVKAAHVGKVIFAETANHQSTIIIQHNEGLVSIYKSNFVTLKKLGTTVNKGDKIAEFKNAGENILQFDCWLNGKPVDPNQFILFE